jgi:N-acetylated-alpha-linked acidic dipeptidase
MKRLSLLPALALALLLPSLHYSQPPLPVVRGFTDAEANERKPFEQRLRAMAEANRVREFMHKMAAEPHHAGSNGGRLVAEYALEQFKSFGLDARIETFEALLPYPVQRSLEVVTPERKIARLREPSLPEDPDSADLDQLPTFLAYSANGDVTAQVVYANYGRQEDYDVLRSRGIDVRGKIVLVRYGRVFRGMKPKIAHENGAVACIIYSDPRDDGYWHGNVYPKGPNRPRFGVQRGSVMDITQYPGDPLTPGRPSIQGTPRLKPEQAATLQRIPAMAISWEDAKLIVDQLAGPMAPPDWRGAIPSPYHLGPGPAAVRLRVENDMQTRVVRDVLAQIKGSEFPNEYVIYGNHHDAWVNGAADPVSGAAAVLEAARILGKAYKAGWRPKRSIAFALWDAEEYGMVGSTEWAEKHREHLLANAVAYFNSDTTLRGRMSIEGSPALERFIEEWMRDFPDPGSSKSLLEMTGKTELELSPLGSGSDYTVFAHHLGIASLNAGYAGNMGGVYHSIYDSIRWFQYFGDPDFVYTTSFAGFMATGLSRLGDATIVPFDFSRVHAYVKRNVEDLKKMPRAKALQWDSLDRELDRMEGARRVYWNQLRAAYPKIGKADRAKIQKLNEAIYTAERLWLRPEGLPGREWYKGQLSAPGKYTGYGAKPLPYIREALEAGNNEEAQQGIAALSECVAAVTERLRMIGKLAAEL